MTGATLLARYKSEVFVWKVRHDGHALEDFIRENLSNGFAFHTVIPIFKDYFYENYVPVLEDGTYDESEEIVTQYPNGYSAYVPNSIVSPEDTDIFMSERILDEDSFDEETEGLDVSYTDVIALIDFDTKQIFGLLNEETSELEVLTFD